jgi:hypothetical protein
MAPSSQELEPPGKPGRFTTAAAKKKSPTVDGFADVHETIPI